MSREGNGVHTIRMQGEWSHRLVEVRVSNWKYRREDPLATHACFIPPQVLNECPLIPLTLVPVSLEGSFVSDPLPTSVAAVLLWCHEAGRKLKSHILRKSTFDSKCNNTYLFNGEDNIWMHFERKVPWNWDVDGFETQLSVKTDSIINLPSWFPYYEIWAATVRLLWPSFSCRL